MVGAALAGKRFQVTPGSHFLVGTQILVAERTSSQQDSGCWRAQSFDNNVDYYWGDSSEYHKFFVESAWFRRSWSHFHRQVDKESHPPPSNIPPSVSKPAESLSSPIDYIQYPQELLQSPANSFLLHSILSRHSRVKGKRT